MKRQNLCITEHSHARHLNRREWVYYKSSANFAQDSNIIVHMGTAGIAPAMPGLSEIGDALVAQGLDNMQVTACPCLVAVLFLHMSRRPSQRM